MINSPHLPYSYLPSHYHNQKRITLYRSKEYRKPQPATTHRHNSPSNLQKTMKPCIVILGCVVCISASPFSASLDESNFSLTERSSAPMCGQQSGGTLCPSSVGKCCSNFGYCGSTDSYCGQGCQSGACMYSKDNTCGSRNGGLLCAPQFGSCCSQYGYCGNTTAYCQSGCQSGACGYSNDNTCGSQNGGLLCAPQFGSCCSQYGYCGNSTAYCQSGCQSGQCSKSPGVQFGGVNIAGCDFGIDTNVRGSPSLYRLLSNYHHRAAPAPAIVRHLLHSRKCSILSPRTNSTSFDCQSVGNT